MLTVSTMSGAWRVKDIVAVGGANFGLVDQNFTWIVALPSGGETVSTKYKGSIYHYPLDSRGDRDCVHYQIDGNFISHGEKFSRTIVNPVGSSYTGPPIRLERFYFPCSGRRQSFWSTGVLTQGLVPWMKIFPPHSYPGNSYRDCWMKGEVEDNLIRIHYHSERLSEGQSVWTVYDDCTPWYEIDSVTLKYRVQGSSTWTSFRSLTNTSAVSSVDYGRLSASDWGRIFIRLKRIHPQYHERDIIGDLCRRCANDAQLLDLNGIEYLADIRNFATELKGLLSLLKGKATLKSASKLFLSYKYGMRLTVVDTINIFQSIPRHLRRTKHNFRWVRAAESTTSTTASDVAWSRSDSYHYKIYYNPYDSGVVNLVDQLWSVGLFPSLENSWDLIPLSFVVDWFTQASDRLSAYDASTFWSCNKVLGGLGSRKTVFEGVQGDVIFSSLRDSAGVATVTEYARFGADTIVTPTFFDDTPREFKNYAEATALLISRSRKIK